MLTPITWVKAIKLTPAFGIKFTLHPIYLSVKVRPWPCTRAWGEWPEYERTEIELVQDDHQGS